MAFLQCSPKRSDPPCELWMNGYTCSFLYYFLAITELYPFNVLNLNTSKRSSNGVTPLSSEPSPFSTAVHNAVISC
jgi:hypothetical protein